MELPHEHIKYFNYGHEGEFIEGSHFVVFCLVYKCVHVQIQSTYFTLAFFELTSIIISDAQKRFTNTTCGNKPPPPPCPQLLLLLLLLLLFFTGGVLISSLLVGCTVTLRFASARVATDGPGTARNVCGGNELCNACGEHDDCKCHVLLE